MLHQCERLVSVLKQFLTFLLLGTLLINGVSFYPIVRHQCTYMYTLSECFLHPHSSESSPQKDPLLAGPNGDSPRLQNSGDIIYFYQGINTCLVLKFMGREGIFLLAYLCLCECQCHSFMCTFSPQLQMVSTSTSTPLMQSVWQR